MAVFLTYQEVAPGIAWVNGRTYKVEKDKKLYNIENLSSAERNNLSKHGRIIQSELELPPAPPEAKGKAHRLMMNLDTGEFFWETLDRPLTVEETQQELGAKLDRIIELLEAQK